MPDKFFLHTCGGMGDHYLGYFNPIRKGYGLGYLNQLKKEYPDSIVKLIAHPANPQGPEFFRHHPYIDEIETHSWVAGLGGCTNKTEEAKDYIEIESFGKEKGWSKVPNAKIYTSKEDDIFLEGILNKKSFIALHPFASDHQRRILETKDFFQLIDTIIERFNMNIIILGGSYKRTRDKERIIEESFTYRKEGLINLIDKTNSRTAAKIVQSSEALIANHSGLWCAAATGKVNLIALHRNPDYHKRWINRIFLDNKKTTVVDVSPKRSKSIIRKDIITKLERVIK